ncbi:3-keto-disaccharide hydrolase [Neorhodopirellula pilleata]|uniref:3-keto-alpha-glucoside-1,2-lyase/3-keto-2-hydroxy-glucal hydratase domain-containing protein n=1 Tax=Neorhodopirellula pilleata TaxID=2714738 RepID=A0A5C5ZH75_9BACT|nr:DUF1080 domain-containing protein [Neorhodopirellula pilleata]TWT86465.1 hypothetical protein Pla100_60360 [Neorhodopirellula pilleata]
MMALSVHSPFATLGDETVRSLEGGEQTVLFDGKSLEGWRGRDDLWRVEDGMIVGRTTDEDPIAENTFLIFNEPIEGDFELTLQFKLEGGNSGIQYRSVVVDEDKFVVSGYQADIDSTNKFAGILYEEKGRGILAKRGEFVTIGEDGKKSVEKFADHDALANTIHSGQWNDYRVVVRGNQLEQFINETKMIQLIDNQTDKARDSGVIALQLHRGPAMTARFKNVTIRRWK